jgi:MOSC domain-containing protein YiiM
MFLAMSRVAGTSGGVETSESALSAQVVGVFVGRPRVIGELRGRPVRSGIAKQRVSADSLRLDETNLAGDRQADLSVHGGPDKAVYVYPTGHYPAWQGDGFALDVGGVAENVALAGATEHDVRLGDVWRWGGAVVQISQPRAPCYKLALHAGRMDVGPRMIETGRCGWYLRVLEPGVVPTSGPITLVDRDDVAPTIHETFRVAFAGGDGNGVGNGRGNGNGDSRDGLARVLSAPALAAAWRGPLVARYGGIGS